MNTVKNTKMEKLIKGRISICIVNYKTEELTRLCLKSIKLNSEYSDYEVIVVDNDSNDKSLEYLRSLSWIKLIERHADVPKGGSRAQGSALDIGLQNATGEYFLAMHSDVFVRRRDWLSFLVSKISEVEGCACAGSGKLEFKPEWLRILKKFTDVKQWLSDTFTPQKRTFYIRAICAIYRTETLLKEKLEFAKNTDLDVTCAKQVYLDLVTKGYPCNIIGQIEMAKYIHHLAHATMVLNPEFSVRDKTRVKYAKKLKEVLASSEIQMLMKDEK